MRDERQANANNLGSNEETEEPDEEFFFGSHGFKPILRTSNHHPYNVINEEQGYDEEDEDDVRSDRL